MPHQGDTWKQKALAWVHRVWTFILSLVVFTSPKPGLPTPSHHPEKRKIALHLAPSLSKRHKVGGDEDTALEEGDDPEARQIGFLPHPSLRMKMKKQGRALRVKRNREGNQDRRRQRELSELPYPFPPVEVDIGDDRTWQADPKRKEVNRSLPRVIITPSTPSEESRNYGRHHWQGRPVSYSVSFVLDDEDEDDEDTTISSWEGTSNSNTTSFDSRPTRDNSVGQDSPDTSDVARLLPEDFVAEVVCRSDDSSEATPPKDNFVFTDSLTELAFGRRPAVEATTTGSPLVPTQGEAPDTPAWAMTTSPFERRDPDSSLGVETDTSPPLATSTPREAVPQSPQDTRRATNGTEGSFYEDDDDQWRKNSLQYADVFDLDMYIDMRASMTSLGLGLCAAGAPDSFSPPPPYLSLDPAYPVATPPRGSYTSHGPSSAASGGDDHSRSNPFIPSDNGDSTNAIVTPKPLLANPSLTNPLPVELPHASSSAVASITPFAPLESSSGRNDNSTLEPFPPERSRRTTSGQEVPTSPSDQNYYNPSIFALQRQAQPEEAPAPPSRSSSPTLPSLFKDDGTNTDRKIFVAHNPTFLRERGHIIEGAQSQNYQSSPISSASPSIVGKPGHGELSASGPSALPPPLPRLPENSSPDRGSTMSTMRTGSNDLPPSRMMTNPDGETFLPNPLTYSPRQIENDNDNGIDSSDPRPIPLSANFVPDRIAQPYVHPSSRAGSSNGPRRLRVVNGPPGSISSVEKSEQSEVEDGVVASGSGSSVAHRASGGATLSTDNPPDGGQDNDNMTVGVESRGLHRRGDSDKENQDVRRPAKRQGQFGLPTTSSFHHWTSGSRRSALLTRVNHQIAQRRAGVLSATTDSLVNTTFSFDGGGESSRMTILGTSDLDRALETSRYRYGMIWSVRGSENLGDSRGSDKIV
ncbi:hypothetical protein CC1G_06172 [Coprinopsis cinerea okayama7|uniref:Uncharacterized protein n=1 Tax=Coprinopsis cinerea (strain Okayama-7 / 130 / ATCC MYA-4618 / FGSC 9003) TaxID=240176 RepID=A8NV27_COPC7|nr:hypothetical protein CC1G_06172 [Coprinopsis cinerea okayama7\|eukprot:XP_001836585.2 hypothetical protein CC1G_06172 [Coprinopsis cinerea okayama7\